MSSDSDIPANPSRPDAFEPGRFAHLVPGNLARHRDAPDTLITVLEVRPSDAMLAVQLGGDDDAVRFLPFEEVGRLEFASGSAQTSLSTADDLERISRNFARRVSIAAEAPRYDATQWTIRQQTEQALAWIDAHSSFVRHASTLPDPNAGDLIPELADDLSRYLQASGVDRMDDTIVRCFRWSPETDEHIKAHRITLARLGLAPYHGCIVRSRAVVSGVWTPARRALHIERRLGFMRALFERFGITELTLFRGGPAPATLTSEDRTQFVRATLRRSEAEAQYQTASDGARLFAEQRVSVERVFMTGYETALEPGALPVILLPDPGNPVF